MYLNPTALISIIAGILILGTAGIAQLHRRPVPDYHRYPGLCGPVTAFIVQRT